MATRELSNALSSGELANIYLGGVLSGNKVTTAADIDALVETAMLAKTG